MAIYSNTNPVIAAKTASYTVRRDEHGKLFTNSGASGAVVFTLPPIADVYAGWNAEFFIVADQTVTITAPSGKLVAFNNAAATSIAFSTTAEKVGARVKIVYDGALYLAMVGLGAETQTPTIS